MGLSGDQAAFPSLLEKMSESLDAKDKMYESSRGAHFGAALRKSKTPANELAAGVANAWLAARFG